MLVIAAFGQTVVCQARDVYVCSSSSSPKYHYRKDCGALKRCSGAVITMTEYQAVQEKKELCKICGKSSASTIPSQVSSLLSNWSDSKEGNISPSSVDYSRLELAKVHLGLHDEVIQHTGFTVSYNESWLIPNWVAWQLTKKEVTVQGKRPQRQFEPDPYVLGRSATHQDYSNSGYSRGHMAPVADMKWSLLAMNESYYLTNVCPQKAELNTRIWNRLEQKSRTLVQDGGTLYICCGPVVEKGHETIGINRVAVPSYFFKVLCRFHNGHWSAIGFLFPNADCKGGMFDYAISVDEIEALTGIDFFYNLPDDIETDVESTWKQKDWQ